MGKVAPGGTVVLIGVTDPEPAQLALASFFGHENAVIRSYFSYAEPTAPGDDLTTLVGLLAAPVGLHTSWDSVNDVLDALADGKIDGKAVLAAR